MPEGFSEERHLVCFPVGALAVDDVPDGVLRQIECVCQFQIIGTVKPAEDLRISQTIHHRIRLADIDAAAAVAGDQLPVCLDADDLRNFQLTAVQLFHGQFIQSHVLSPPFALRFADTVSVPRSVSLRPPV